MTTEFCDKYARPRARIMGDSIGNPNGAADPAALALAVLAEVAAGTGKAARDARSSLRRRGARLEKTIIQNQPPASRPTL